ncbi:MAG: tRNA 2-selenouridine(34) synthase MnmH [Tumebacillaceae bacterium]
MAFKEIHVSELYEVPGRILIDVRSPGEFQEGSVPGALNIPLFTDAERAHIGTVYKHESPAAARRLAMLTVSPKIPQLVEAMEPLLEQGQLVIFCWRGGMRSFAACTFMDLLKYPVWRLRGGYRAYRQMVIDRLAEVEGLVSPLFVLHGLTGVGKSRILLMLKERGHQVLDLERMAKHRGSVFGSIGLGEPNNQKTFDAHLWEFIRMLDPQRPVFMEAESRRIGRAVMPEWLDRDKHEGVPVLVEASLDKRVERLIEDYLPEQDERVQEGLFEALYAIQKRIRRDDFQELLEMLNNRKYRAFCSKILASYYDPKYLHKLKEYREAMLTVDAEDLDRAVLRLEALADQMMRDRRGKPQFT